METDEVLTHHGVKGQKWGVRRSKGAAAVSVAQKGKKLKATGGVGHKPSSDAVTAKKIGQVKKKSGLHALSNEQLQAYQRRLQLEQSVKQLDYQNKNSAQKFVSTLLGNSGKQTANQVASAGSTKAASKIIKKAGLAAAVAA